MKLKIKVTEEDIKNGKPKDSSLCPIALASSRCIEEYFKSLPDTIEVDGDIIFTIGGRTYKNYNNTTEINAFIDAFDSTLEVEPFEKDIEFQEQEPEYDSDEY